MATALQLKKDIQLNLDLTSVLGVMQDIAVSQFHSLDKKKQRFKKIMEAFKEFFSMINLSGQKHPLIESQNENMAIIMISSDEGFMGGLNNKVINAALAYRKNRKAEMFMVGSRGADSLKSLGEKCVAFPGVDMSNRYQLAENIKDHIMKGVKENRFGHCILSYAKPISFSVQKIEVEILLPSSRIYSKDVTDKESKRSEPESPAGQTGPPAPRESFILESPLEGILEYLAGTYIVERLFLVFEENKLSEYGARANHLEGSCQYLKTQGKKIKLDYIKRVHAKVDQGMRETFASQILKKKNEKN
jgi:ATP synthase F1 gamma subunit